MEFSFQAQDHNALAISIVRFLVALPPSGTCYSAPNICSSQPELCARQKTAALRDFSPLYVRFGSKAAEMIEPMRRPMSALLRKRTNENAPLYVRFVPIPDIGPHLIRSPYGGCVTN